MFKKFFLSSAVIMTAISCAQMEQTKVPVKTFTVNPSQDLGLTSNTLKEQVEAALKVGGRAPEYLASDLFIKGNDASIRGDFQTAASLFKFVSTLAPQDSYVQKKLAIELIRMGDLKEAETILAKLYNRAGKGDESVGLILAGVYTALEKNAYARDIYKKLIAESNSEEACLYLAKAYSADKKYSEAHQLLANCEKKNNDEPSFAFYRGKIEYERGKVAEAKKFFENSLKIDKSFSQAVLALGAIYEDKEEFNKALVIYKKFLAEDNNSQNTVVLNKLVNILLNNDDNSTALPYLETLVTLDTDDLNMKVRLGLLYSDLTKYDQALKVFNSVLEVVPDSDKILYYVGALHQQMNNPEEAVSKYLKIQNNSPLFNDASVQIGQIYSMRAREDFTVGKKENVEKFHKFVEQRVKEHEDLGLELKMVEAGFYDDTFRYKDAIEMLAPYKTAQTFTDSHSYYLASLFEKNGQVAEARGMIQKILEKDPNNPHALNFIGYSWLEKNENMEKAFEYISKAVKLKPDDGYIRDSLAWYYYSVGKYTDALREAKKAFELVKTDVTISKHLAKIYESMKNYEKAKEFYAEALKNAKANAEREEVLKQIDGLEQKRLPASEH